MPNSVVKAIKRQEEDAPGQPNAEDVAPPGMKPWAPPDRRSYYDVFEIGRKRLACIATFVLLAYHVTVVLRVSLWFRPATWEQHETKSALFAVCHNRTCTTKPEGPTAALANMHVYGSLARKPTTTARILRNTMPDGVDVGKSDETDLWYWNLRQQAKLQSSRYVPSLISNTGLSVCLTRACTNAVYFKVGTATYAMKEVTQGSFGRIGAYNVYDRVCYFLYRADPLSESLPSNVVVQLSGGNAGTENIYTMLMSEIGGTPSMTPMTFLAMREHFKCTDPNASGGHEVYHGLDAGSILTPPQYKPWKGVLMDTAYATAHCAPLDISSQYRFAFAGSNTKDDKPFTWQLSAALYAGIVSSWRNGSLLPGYESIVDTNKLLHYIAECDDLKDFYLRWKLLANLTDVRTSVDVRSSTPVTISASRTMAYSFKDTLMARVLPANYSSRYPGGLQIVVEDPGATHTDNNFLQSSILMVFAKNSATKTVTTGFTVVDTPPTGTGVLSYLEMDILTSIYSFPGIEVLVQKLLNSTMKAMQAPFCTSFSTKMHNYRGEVNKTETYLRICNSMFDAYEAWKLTRGGAPPQPVRDDLPEISPYVYFNNDDKFSSTDLELASAVFTSVDRGNLVTITQGLLSIRIGYRGFHTPVNATYGIMAVEDKPRLFAVNSKFPVRSNCDKMDQSYFYSDGIRKHGKVIALIAAAIVSLAAIPAFYVFCRSTMEEQSVFSILDVQDMIMTVSMGVLNTRVAMLIFSCCSAFVSRVRPEISWDPWYADTSLGIDLSWLPWLLTASSSGAYLYGLSCFGEDCGLSRFALRGIAVPSVINILIPCARFLLDWCHISNVAEYDDDWAAMPSPLVLGGMELVWAGFVFAILMSIAKFCERRRKRKGAVVAFEPYLTVAACLARSRTLDNNNRVPGWLLTLGGYRTVISKDVTYLSRAGFMAAVQDNKITGHFQPAQGLKFHGWPVHSSLS